MVIIIAHLSQIAHAPTNKLRDVITPTVGVAQQIKKFFF